MAASRILALSLIAMSITVSTSLADAFDSTYYRWNSWAPPVRNLTGGYSLPASLLSSTDLNASPVSSWKSSPSPASVPSSANAPVSVVLPAFHVASQPIAPSAVTAPAPVSVPASPTPSLASNFMGPSVAPASSAPINSGGAGIQWNYGQTLSSLATAMSNVTAGNGPTYNAFLNMGSGPYASDITVTSGGAAPWYLSPTVEKLYGGVPSAAQQLQFSQTVLARVQSTYHNSGLDVSLTTDPNAHSQHTISVVSGASSPVDPQAIGMTAIGLNGFTFIDKLNYASSVDELEWAVAHNIAYELTHSFGVPDRIDSSGKYIDALVTPWSTLVDPNALLSPGLVSTLKSTNFGTSLVNSGLAAQELGLSAAPVPEPATYLTWLFAVLATGGWIRRQRAKRAIGMAL